MAKKFKGIVVSTKMTNTVVVEVKRLLQHPLYKKTISRKKRYLVDSRNHKVKEGDIVEIIECRPISKKKHFTIYKVY